MDKVYFLNKSYQKFLIEMLLNINASKWCTVDEKKTLKDVVEKGHYDETEKIILNNVMKYYEKNISFYGTIRNPINNFLHLSN